MKENRNHGSILRGLLGLIFLGVGITILVINLFFSGTDTLVKEGKILSPDEVSGNTVAMRVTAIYPQPITDITVADGKTSGESLYLVQYQGKNEEYGIVGLEATRSDKTLKSLLAAGDKLADKPQWIEVEIKYTHEKDSLQDYASIKDYFKDSELQSSFPTTYYVSLMEAKSNHTGKYVVIALFSILGLIFLVLAVKIRIDNGKNYDRLYENYPELNGQLESLPTVAGFYDGKMKVAVYKHHILTFSDGFYLFDLNEAERLYHYIVTTKAYGFITTNRASQLVVVPKNAGKRYFMKIKNRGKYMDIDLAELFAYVEKEFPHVALGYDGEPKQGFGSQFGF